MRLPFYTDLKDETTGFEFLADIEVEIEADIGWDGGEPRLVIDGCFAVCRESFLARRERVIGDERLPEAGVSSVDMMAAGEPWKQIALHVMAQAEEDDDLLLAALAAHDIVFAGHPNDPDSHYRVEGARI